MGASHGPGSRPDVQSFAWDDFDRADEAIEAGAAAAHRALPRIQKLLNPASRCARRIPGSARSRSPKLSLARGGIPMIRLASLVAAVIASLLLWHECGEDVGVFCYRIGLGAFTTMRSRELVPVPAVLKSSYRGTVPLAGINSPLSPLALQPRGLRELIRSGGAPFVCTIVFIETGFFVGFFLPGDSLLITAGIFSSAGVIPLKWLLLPVMLCAIAGDQVGYWIGRSAVPRFTPARTLSSSAGPPSARARFLRKIRRPRRDSRALRPHRSNVLPTRRWRSKNALFTLSAFRLFLAESSGLALRSLGATRSAISSLISASTSTM